MEKFFFFFQIFSARSTFLTAFYENFWRTNQSCAQKRAASIQLYQHSKKKDFKKHAECKSRECKQATRKLRQQGWLQTDRRLPFTTDEFIYERKKEINYDGQKKKKEKKRTRADFNPAHRDKGWRTSEMDQEHIYVTHQNLKLLCILYIDFVHRIIVVLVPYVLT